MINVQAGKRTKERAQERVADPLETEKIMLLEGLASYKSLPNRFSTKKRLKMAGEIEGDTNSDALNALNNEMYELLDKEAFVTIRYGKATTNEEIKPILGELEEIFKNKEQVQSQIDELKKASASKVKQEKTFGQQCLLLMKRKKGRQIFLVGFVKIIETLPFSGWRFRRE